MSAAVNWPGQRPRSGSRHSRHPSGDRLGAIDDRFHIAGTGNDDDDLLSPLSYATGSNHRRPNRQRVDSYSSIGSSVAPAALPRRHVSSRRQASEGAERRPVSRGATAMLPSMHSIQSGMSDSNGMINDAPATSIGEGGLDAWLRSQAVAGPPNLNGNVNGRSVAIPSRSRNASANIDALSDTGRSVGARSAGYRQYGSGSRGMRSGSGVTRSALPTDWEAGDADGGGLGVPSLPAKRRDGSGKGGLRDWLEAADVDSQVPSERRTRRRDVSAGTMSASGVRLRESVRRMARPGAEEHASLAALLSSAAGRERNGLTGQLRNGTMSASPSMGMGHGSGGVSLAAILAESNPSKARSGVVHDTDNKEIEVRGESSQSALRIWAKSLLSESKSSAKEPSRSASMLTPLVSAVLISALVKWLAGLSGWSGRGRAPMFGDFEAQRHWIEITLHLPPRQWYFYDLPYWGLDYPPLTAAVSRWCGLAAKRVFPALAPHFALHSSRGSEAPELVLFMRLTVLILDLLVYTPALLFFLNRKLHGRGRRTRAIASISALLQPALILVDYGHFQYNAVMLGLAAAAFALLYTALPNPDEKANAAGSRKGGNRLKSLSRRVSYEYIAAAVFFSLSLSFKQMALYYAPAIFAIMLGRCVGLARVGFERGLICFFGIALATTLTFAITFRHWLTDLGQIGQVIHRIFPVARGLFEDKVSNIWCFLSVLPLPARYKLKNAMSVKSLTRLSLASTLLAILVPCVHLFAAAAETVHIEMFLDEESRKQVLASEKRKAEGSVIGASSISGRRPRHMSTQTYAPSDAGSEMLSIGGARSIRSTVLPPPTIQEGSGKVIDQPHVVASSSPSPAASILPYALLSTSMAFFLLGFQTHEKTILLPLLPMTLLMSVKGDEWGGGAGKVDWEWAVLMNNVAVFSMWPLLQRDEVALQYVLVTCGWNWIIGYRPFAGLSTYRKTFVAWIGAAVHLAMLALHSLEMLNRYKPSLAAAVMVRYPDLFAVLNVLLCTPVFVLIWLWASKRQIEVGFAVGIDLFGAQQRSKKQKSQRDQVSDRKTR